MFFDNWETVLLVCTVMGGLLLALLWWQLVADMFNWIKEAKGGDSRESPISEWADSRRWSTLARELIKYQDAFKVEDPRHCLLILDLFRYSKSEQKAASILGWIFLQALRQKGGRWSNVSTHCVLSEPPASFRFFEI